MALVSSAYQRLLFITDKAVSLSKNNKNKLKENMGHLNPKNHLDNIKAFKKRFAELPRIAAYISSDKFMRGPCNNKMASWGGDKELKRTW